MALEPSKVSCDECNWAGKQADLDLVTDPKPKPGMEADVWSVCPACRAPEHIQFLCDEPGCSKVVTCGWNDKAAGVYRRTCYAHSNSKVKNL